MKKIYLLGSVALLSIFQSCDAVLFLNYQVKNSSGKPVQIKIEAYGDQPFAHKGKDTTITLKPGESFIVGRSMHQIGFPGDEKLIYDKYPSCNNFSLMQGDSVIVVKPGDKEWKYGSGYSTFRITKKNLPASY